MQTSAFCVLVFFYFFIKNPATPSRQTILATNQSLRPSPHHDQELGGPKLQVEIEECKRYALVLCLKLLCTVFISKSY